MPSAERRRVIDCAVEQHEEGRWRDVWSATLQKCHRIHPHMETEFSICQMKKVEF